MTIFKKVILKADAEPEVGGTRLSLEIGADSLTAGLYSLTLADGHESGTVDWGDGTLEEVGTRKGLRHAYAAPGRYEVLLSDDFVSLRYGTTDKYWPGADAYKPLLREFASTAKSLLKLEVLSFENCVNLTKVDVVRSRIETIEKHCFHACTGLSGELFFPCVSSLGSGTSTTRPPFGDCTGGLTKIHFAAANAEAIRATEIYKADPTLGSGTAETVFDL